MWCFWQWETAESGLLAAACVCRNKTGHSFTHESYFCPLVDAPVEWQPLSARRICNAKSNAVTAGGWFIICIEHIPECHHWVGLHHGILLCQSPCATHVTVSILLLATTSMFLKVDASVQAVFPTTRLFTVCFTKRMSSVEALTGTSIPRCSFKETLNNF